MQNDLSKEKIEVDITKIDEEEYIKKLEFPNLTKTYNNKDVEEELIQFLKEAYNKQEKSINKRIDSLNKKILDSINQESISNKINKITKEQEHLQLEIEDSMSLNQGLNKFKTLFKNNEIMPNFDKDVFELMIEKVIIGEKGSKGKGNPRVITFILKSDDEIKCEEDNKNSVVKENLTTEENQNQQSSYEAQENYLQKVSEPCGVRDSAICKINPVIVEFTVIRDCDIFNKKK